MIRMTRLSLEPQWLNIKRLFSKSQKDKTLNTSVNGQRRVFLQTIVIPGDQ